MNNPDLHKGDARSHLNDAEREGVEGSKDKQKQGGETWRGREAQ